MRSKKSKKSINPAFPFKNTEELALYYCREAGIENFKDLKNTIYWGYYQEDCKRFYKKTIADSKFLPAIKETSGIITCKSCGNTLGAIIDNFVILDFKNSFKKHDSPLKIVCPCGEYNTFEELKIETKEDSNDEQK